MMPLSVQFQCIYSLANENLCIYSATVHIGTQEVGHFHDMLEKYTDMPQWVVLQKLDALLQSQSYNLMLNAMANVPRPLTSFINTPNWRRYLIAYIHWIIETSEGDRDSLEGFIDVILRNITPPLILHPNYFPVIEYLIWAFQSLRRWKAGIDADIDADIDTDINDTKQNDDDIIPLIPDSDNDSDNDDNDNNSDKDFFRLDFTDYTTVSDISPTHTHRIICSYFTLL